MSPYNDQKKTTHSRHAHVFHREPAEYATIEESFNPSIHRVNHAVKARAIHSAGSVPEIPKVLLRFSAPPQDLIERVQNQVESLIQAAEVKKGMCNQLSWFYLP